MHSTPGVTDPGGTVHVLSVSAIEADHSILEGSLKYRVERSNSKWVIHRSVTVADAMVILEATVIPVAICESELATHTWRDLLQQSAGLAEPPVLIVSSRLADERLWVEAMNLGAYDVLAKPFEGSDLIRSVTGAWLHWQGRREARARRLRDQRAVEQWNAGPG